MKSVIGITEQTFSGVARGGRLGSSLSGTNLERAADYNQRIVLQAIRMVEETTRAELSAITGLTQPTIANIARRLIDLGLIREAGRRSGMRGQPALRIEINPDGCFAIGLNIDRDHFTVLALDLAGNVRERSVREMEFATPQQVQESFRQEVAAIRASGTIDCDRLIGVGVALPDDLGSVALPHRPDGYEVWNDLDVAALIRDVLPLPVHIDNDAAAAALGETQFAGDAEHRTFFYVLISAGLGGGLVVDGTYVRGAHARSGEIGFLPDYSAPHAHATVQDTVSVSALLSRLETTRGRTASLSDLIDPDPKAWLVIDRWLDDAARSLVGPLMAVSCVVDPASILIGGRLPDPLVDDLVARLNRRMHGAKIPSVPPVLRAATSGDAPAIGAAMLPFLDRFLPTETALMQSLRPN